MRRAEAEVREKVALAIEQAFTDWAGWGDLPPYPLHSPQWLVQRAYAHAASIARTPSEDES